LYDYLHIGWNNNPVEVKKLQVFLHDLEGYDVSVTGIYDAQTVTAVNAFQVKYGSDILVPWDGTYNPSSFTYILTKKKVNEIYCQTAFPLTVQQQSVIDAYRQFVNDLSANGVNISTPPTQEQIDNAGNSTTTASSTNEIGSAVTNLFANLAIGGPSSSTTKAVLSNLAGAIFGYPWNWMKNLFNPTLCTPGTAHYFIALDILIVILLIIIAYLLWENRRKNKNPQQ
jgi:peptidoglycan hydrolase-like protein with peptidoglycan-binding domain